MSDDLMPHFDEPWQREAWEAERAEIAERRRRLHEASVEPIDIASALANVRPTIVPDAPRSCSLQRMPGRVELGDACDGYYHQRHSEIYDAWEVIGRCPERRSAEIRGSVAAERARLAEELKQIAKHGSTGFDGYDAMHGKGSEAAITAALEFSQGRPPTRGVFLMGTTGLGKTRLLIASHLALLEGGVRSMYVRTPELRAAFDRQQTRQRSFDEDERGKPEELLERLRRTAVVHLDDVGNVEDDERKAGAFREGLKDILDQSSAAWMTACNLMSFEAAKKHPDVGPKILSRLASGAVVVRMEGTDWRIDHAVRRR